MINDEIEDIESDDDEQGPMPEEAEGIPQVVPE